MGCRRRQVHKKVEGCRPYELSAGAVGGRPVARTAHWRHEAQR